MRCSTGYLGDPLLRDFVGMNDVFLSYRDLLLYSLGCANYCMGAPFLANFVRMNDVFLSYKGLLLYSLGCTMYCMGDPFLADFVGMNDVFLSYSDLLLYNLGCMAEGAKENLRPGGGLLLGWLLPLLLLLLLRCMRCAVSCRSRGTLQSQTLGHLPLLEVRYG